MGWLIAFIILRRLELGGIRKLRGEAETETERLVQSARAEADNVKRSASLEAKEEVLRAKEAWDDELAKRRGELERTERRLDQRESLLDRKLSELDQKHDLLDKRASELETREKAIELTAYATKSCRRNSA